MVRLKKIKEEKIRPSNEKFLNQTGLAYYNTKVKGELDKKIEKIKVNGTEQTITNKEVDLAVAEIKITNTDSKKAVKLDNSDGTELEVTLNDNGLNIAGADNYNILFDKDLVDKNYVDANGGKIDKIKVNGTEQTITNKEVDLLVPEMRAQGSQLNVNGAGMQVNDADDYLKIIKSANGVRLDAFHLDNNGTPASGITNLTIPDKNYVDTNFRTQQQVQDAIDAALAGVTGFEYQMVGELPETGEKGIIYLVSNSGSGENVFDEYIWIVTPPTPTGDTGYFEKIGTTAVDLSGYWNDTNLVAITTAEIDALFA